MNQGFHFSHEFCINLDSERAGATLKIGFVTDIHEDAESLRHALLILDKHKCDCICCLGDITGFSEHFFQTVRRRDRRECIKLIKENCSLTVAGNHDLHTIERITEFRNETKLSGDWYSLTLDERKQISQGRLWLYEDELPSPPLSDEESDFLAQLPEKAELLAGNQRIMLTHFAYPDISGSTVAFPKNLSDAEMHFQYLLQGGCSLSFSGHGHPEGAMVWTDQKVDFHRFGIFQFDEKVKWVVLPPVVRSNRRNGVTIFDSNLRTLLTLELSE